MTLIRQNYGGTATVKGKVESIVPEFSPDKPFIRNRLFRMVREWADGKTSAAFRVFDIVRTGDANEPNILPPGTGDAILRMEEVTVTIAYPDLPMLYGDDPDSIEDTIRTDARQVRDALIDPGHLIAGCQAVMPNIKAPQRGNGIWFQDVVCEITYYEAQTFTAAQGI